MSILDGEVVMWTVDVGWDDGCEVTSIFFCIGSVHGIDETFGICVAFVGWVRRSIMKHGFINGVGCFVGEDTGGKEGNQLFDFCDATKFHNVVVDESVFSIELNLSLAIMLE